tara:strand:- start:539 stop:1519 length:981 start_codon:yes stop_codon:yes gene_type:complete
MKRAFDMACCLVWLSAVFLWGDVAQAEGQSRFITIGTGGANGAYHPVASAICGLINRMYRSNGLRCTVEPTNGPVYTIYTVHSGDFDFGIVQSDVQSEASHGTGDFAQTGKIDDLRSVFSAYLQTFTVLARADAGVTDFDDLKGKRVNIGNPGSAQRDTMERVMAAKGWTLDDFAMASELDPMAQVKALCQHRIDATVYAVAHPSQMIRQAVQACDTVLVDVEGLAIDRLLVENPYYQKETIPGGLYYGNPEPVQTFRASVTLMAAAKTDAAIVYQLVKTVFGNFGAFKGQHSALAGLSKNAMVHDDLPAPLHEGALRFYREAGLM